MKTKYIEILDLVLSNPANQLSKSSRDMLDTMKNGLKIEKEDHSEEMLSMLENCRNALKITYGCNVDRIEELINKVKDNETVV